MIQVAKAAADRMHIGQRVKMSALGIAAMPRNHMRVRTGAIFSIDGEFVVVRRDGISSLRRRDFADYWEPE